MKVSRCKGMRDLLPEDMAKFRQVEGQFRDCCTTQGYREVRTPTLEYLYLFTATGTLTPAMLGKVYSFLDWDGWSGERVVLRPEGTIPAARLYLEHLQDGDVARLFYVENTFTFEEAGADGRERWQCGAELIGSDLPAADVELITLALEVMERLGIGPIEVRLSHAGLIRALLAEVGLDATAQTAVLDQVLEGDVAALGSLQTGDDNLRRALSTLLDTRGSAPGFLENVRAFLGEARPRFEASLNNLAAIAQLLSSLGRPYHIDIASGRGFEYYTGIMFQLYHDGERLGGGGRYDELIPLVGGPPTPASGVALYVDRLMDLVAEAGRGRPEGVLLVPQGSGLKAHSSCLELARLLRKAGHLAEIDLGRGQTAGYRWLLSVPEEGPLLLTDTARGTSSEAASWEDVAKAMEGPR